MLSEKLALGTVQFGLEYGISNPGGLASDTELQKIIAGCSTHSVNTFDTASAYGNAETRLGTFLPSEVMVIGKFTGTSEKQIRSELLTSLSNLKTTQLHGYLAHRVNDIIQNPSVWETVENLKKENLILKSGISIYTPSELTQVIELGIHPDIVQLPYNLLDRRMLDAMAFCSMNGIEVHVRSVFLQGLFFLNPKALPPHLELFKEPLFKIASLAKENNLSVLALALQFVLKNEFVTKAIVGVQSSQQLNEIISACSAFFDAEKLMSQISDIKIADNYMLLPQNWK
jgi:aryl-alcohol dehydrogenase-like predicted oxidoreductase